jgi:hypothetical protein
MSLLFLFVQFEFTHAVGPHAGRYVVEPALLSRDGEAPGARAPVGPAPGARTAAADSSPVSLDPWLDNRNRQVAGTTRGVGATDVLVVTVLGAPPVRFRILRRARELSPPVAPDDVPLSLVSFVKGSQPLSHTKEASAALDEVKFSDQLQRQWVQVGLRVLNAAIRGYRAGAPDPYAIEVLRRDARKIRIGYGTTDEVQNGGFQSAIELPPGQAARATRIERLRPSEAVATVLTGRGAVLEGEDLLLRALVDLDHERTRAAVFQVAAALRLIPSELRPHPGADQLDFAVFQRALESTEVLVRAVVERPLRADEVAQLEGTIDAVAGVLDGWRYHQVEP